MTPFPVLERYGTQQKNCGGLPVPPPEGATRPARNLEVAFLWPHASKDLSVLRRLLLPRIPRFPSGIPACLKSHRASICVSGLPAGQISHGVTGHILARPGSSKTLVPKRKTLATASPAVGTYTHVRRGAGEIRMPCDSKLQLPQSQAEPKGPARWPEPALHSDDVDTCSSLASGQAITAAPALSPSPPTGQRFWPCSLGGHPESRRPIPSPPAPCLPRLSFPIS